MHIVISSGHGKYIRGAADILDEVNEARRVVPRVAECLQALGHTVTTFHDDVSTTQDENLHRIVSFHNSKKRDLDVSVHFNAYEHTSKPMGTEVLYVTQHDLAKRVADSIAAAGHMPNRGPKKRTDLFFLNNTTEPAILIETCFVDSVVDAENYRKYFDAICKAIAGTKPDDLPVEPEPPASSPPEIAALFSAQGACSWFGGPADTSGVSADEGLAFFSSYDEAPHLFLEEQPAGSTGLARRLNPYVYYVACRWDYDVTPKEMLRQKSQMALVLAAEGRRALAWPADWGPNEATGRVADLSHGLLNALCLQTDDQVTVIYPYVGGKMEENHNV